MLHSQQTQLLRYCPVLALIYPCVVDLLFDMMLLVPRNFAHVFYRHPPEEQREDVPFDGEFQLRYDTERTLQNGVFYVDGE